MKRAVSHAYGKMHDDNEIKYKCKLYNHEHWLALLYHTRTYIIQCWASIKNATRTCIR